MSCVWRFWFHYGDMVTGGSCENCSVWFPWRDLNLNLGLGTRHNNYFLSHWWRVHTRGKACDICSLRQVWGLRCCDIRLLDPRQHFHDRGCPRWLHWLDTHGWSRLLHNHKLLCWVWAHDWGAGGAWEGEILHGSRRRGGLGHGQGSSIAQHKVGLALEHTETTTLKNITSMLTFWMLKAMKDKKRSFRCNSGFNY